MIKRVLSYSAAVVLGVAAGVVSALVMSGLWSGKQPMEFSDVNVDGWVSDFAVGSDQASPYVRARVARHGLLALAKSEAVYFMRNADNALYQAKRAGRDRVLPYKKADDQRWVLAKDDLR